MQAPSTAIKTPEGAAFRSLLSASGFFSLFSRLGTGPRQAAGGDTLSSLVQNLIAFASRPPAGASSTLSPKGYSPLRALIALALEAKGLLPLLGHNPSLAYRSFGRSLASRGNARSHLSSKARSSSLEADGATTGDTFKEGSRLLDSLDGLVAGLLGPFDGGESPDKRKGQQRPPADDTEEALDEDPVEEPFLVQPMQDVATFNRTPLPDGKRWLILPFDSVDTDSDLTAVFSVLVDRPGPDGRESVLSLAAEIRACGRLWSLRLPRALSSKAPLLVSCDDTQLLKEPSCSAAARALAATMDLELVLHDGEPGFWPDEWGQSMFATDVLA